MALSRAGLGFFWPHPTGMAFRDGEPVRYGFLGSSDIVGCAVGGFFVGIEVKTGSGALRENQVRFRDAIWRRGGIFIEARSVEQTLADLERELRTRRVHGLSSLFAETGGKP